jgi:PKD repeat protein
VDFDARGSTDPDGGSIYQVWDFGDPAAGQENRSTQPAVRHVFEQAGTFVVRLTTSDDEGSVVTQETTITVVASADDEGGFACAASTGSSSGGVDASFLLASALVFLWISRLKARAVGRLARG